MMWHIKDEDNVDKKVFVLISCRCTRLYLSHDDRSLKAIEVAEAWVQEKVTLDEVKSAVWLAEDAVYSAEQKEIQLNIINEESKWLARAVVWSARTAAWSDKEENIVWPALAARRTIEQLVEVNKLDLQKQCANIIREYFPVAPKI